MWRDAGKMGILLKIEVNHTARVVTNNMGQLRCSIVRSALRNWEETFSSPVGQKVFITREERMK